MLRRPAWSAVSQSNLRIVAAVAGLPLHSSHPQSETRASIRRRCYTQSPFRKQELRNAPASSQDVEPEQDVQADQQTSSFTPWYLQVETPSPPVSSAAHQKSLAERQAIPPLPEAAPPILDPLLQYISVDLGLDSLSLLDLRSLNPPPALGANLIMIIGTARSVPHLNKSADRFCRWLRKEWRGVRPVADGLLGRQELKVKLRRRNKRLKLARSVGNTLEEQKSDDGVTTGWVCVNVGTVDQAIRANECAGFRDEEADVDPSNLRRPIQDDIVDEHIQDSEEEEWLDQEVEDRHDRFIGFGERSASPRIVVQMFTEEKRAEMDLEGLWDVRTKRRADKDERGVAEALEKLAEIGKVDAFGTPKEQIEFKHGAPPGELMRLGGTIDPTWH